MASRNELSLNVIETRAVVVGTRPNLKISDKKVESPSFTIDDSQIEIVEKAKYSGVNIINFLFGMSTLDSCVLRFLAL